MNTTNKKIMKQKSKIQQTYKSSVIQTLGMSSDTSKQKQQMQNVEIYHKKVRLFMKTLKSDYKRLAVIYNACISVEQEKERRNKEEIDQLKKVYNQMQVENTDIKRKRWCRYCESEATYLSLLGANFYCSPECEQKQNDLVSAMDDIHEA